ncbi:MAG TPA: chloride channel protein [Bryobacterales bacterium]|nr:chloride channel protein [Bryobacterales bacterium]
MDTLPNATPSDVTPGKSRAWLKRPAMSEGQRFLLLAVLIGLFAGLAVVCFHVAIEFLSWRTLGAAAGASRLGALLSPALGGLVAAFLALRVFPAAAGSGVNQTKEAIYISDGYLPFSGVIGKFLACSLSIGAGNPMGPEDPSLQMGAGIASLLGRLFRLPRANMRLIAAVGAAAGLAAAFNTPIAAVLFVIEEVLAGWRAGVLGSIVLASVSAAVVVRWFLGDEPLFRVPAFQLTHPSELLVYAGIGVIGGVLSALFVKWVGALRDALGRWPRWTRYLQPGAAGLLVGCAGLWLPAVMGAGYDSIDAALHNHFAWPTLLALGVVKMALVLICFSAGTPGGMFAPTLFIGAMIGGGIGGLARLQWPSRISSPDAYVLVGMGTFFAGVFRAPMTSIFMVFEATASYVIILPVMIANMVAYLISLALQRAPFFSLVARHEGVVLPSLEEQREQPVRRVEDAMQPAPVPVVLAREPLASAMEAIRSRGLDRCLVAKGDGVWSSLRREDLEVALGGGDGSRTVEQALPLAILPRLYPDLTLDAALEMMGPHAILPVASRAHPEQLMGTLTLEDVHRAYGIGGQG